LEIDFLLVILETVQHLSLHRKANYIVYLIFVDIAHKDVLFFIVVMYIVNEFSKASKDDGYKADAKSHPC